MCIAVVVGTCVFPTEHDASVRVSLTPLHILFRGEDTVVTARAWQMTGPADSQPIPNVVFVWTSSDPSVATVDGAGHVVGITSGKTVIRAAAANFDQHALAATDTLRVAAPLEIDSVRPRTIQYGEILNVYGVSVDSIFAASLHGAALIRVPFSDTVFPSGTTRSRWWVPPPAQTDSLFFLGITGSNGVLGYVHGDTTTVVEHDLYEANDTTPTVIDLDAPPPIAAYPTIVFTNPALAFEPLKRDVKTGADWYRFTHAQTEDVTIVLTAPQIAGTFVTYLTDSLGWDPTSQQFFIGKNAWTFGPSSHACHGKSFAPSEARGDSTIVAFKGLPAGTLDAIATYLAPGRYGLTAIAGYQSELPPDAHEDDNSCNAADLRGAKTVPFRDTLNIENPHDIDWIRFTVSSAVQHRFRLHAFPGVHPDSLKDLDLYLVRVPSPSDPAVQIVMADTASGSDVNRVVIGLPAGDYYVVVLDYAGTTTKYELCVSAGACPTPFPAPTSGPRRPADPIDSRLAPVPRQ